MGEMVSGNLGYWYAGDTYLVDTQFISGEHFQADAIAFHRLSDMRHMTQPLGHKTADGSRFRLFLRTECQKFVEAVDVHGSRYHVGSLRLFHDIALRFVLVVNFAENFFDHIFHGHQAGRVSVFIDHDGHVGAILLHLAEQYIHGLALRHNADGTGQFLDGAALALLLVEFEHVAHMDEPDDQIDGSGIYGNAR